LGKGAELKLLNLFPLFVTSSLSGNLVSVDWIPALAEMTAPEVSCKEVLDSLHQFGALSQGFFQGSFYWREKK
jgi:hypothetical protein